MLKKEYHCLVAGLPDLFFNENKALIDSVSFRQQLQAELSSSDYDLVKLIYLAYDNENLLDQLLNRKRPFRSNGIFSKPFLLQQLSPGDETPELPLYMLDFIEWFEDMQTEVLDLNAEIVMQQLYYGYILKVRNDFLRNWFLFQLNEKNILTTANCIRFDYNIEEQLIKADENKNVCTLLIGKKLKPELFEDEVPFYREIFKVTESNLNWMEREKAIDKIKWDYLDENTVFHYFTVEKILSYVLKLDMVERWIKLDRKKGEELLQKLINDFKASKAIVLESTQTK